MHIISTSQNVLNITKCHQNVLSFIIIYHITTRPTATLHITGYSEARGEACHGVQPKPEHWPTSRAAGLQETAAVC